MFTRILDRNFNLSSTYFSSNLINILCIVSLCVYQKHQKEFHNIYIFLKVNFFVNNVKIKTFISSVDKTSDVFAGQFI